MSISVLNELSAGADKNQTAKLVSDAIAAGQFARDWRNRWIAHRDHDVALKEAASPLAEATVDLVKTAFAAIGTALDACDPDGATTMWEPLSASPRGVSSLFWYLREGLSSRERKLRSCERGEMKWSERWGEPI